MIVEQPLNPLAPDAMTKLKINRVSHPELFAVHGLQRTVGEEQKLFRDAIQPVLDILQKGPLSFHEALDLGLVDAPHYHQDILRLLRDEGIKTWSVRKYLDANIAQQIFGDINNERWVIPQLLKKSGKEKGSLKEKDGVAGAHLDIKLLVAQHAPNAEPSYDEAVLQVDVVVPRNIGLVYLDNAIEGFHHGRLKLTFVGKDDSVAKRLLHIF